MYCKGDKQQTIEDEIDYSGIALHSGENINIKLKPAEADSGIVFKRVDLPNNPEIKADPWNVVSTKRCTSIGRDKKQAVIHTVEHMMAAFWALKIDNVIIEIDGPETPVADGSSYPFIELLERAGSKELDKSREVWSVEEPIWLRRGKMYMTLLPYDGFKISYTLDYKNPVIGTQFREFDVAEDSFLDEIAKARTFGFEKEVEALHKRGLALGGSLENAVLIGETETINSVRYEDEFVRHKILDVIGDMALNGFIKGHIITVRSGHSLHVELAQEISKKLKKQESEKNV